MWWNGSCVAPWCPDSTLPCRRGGTACQPRGRFRRMGEPIEIVLNGERRRLTGVSPAMTLLDWLRGPARLTGTKEGCAEGDCGACTVLVETPGARLPINACLALVGQMHGCAIRTVEGLRGPDGAPHPVQRALAESDGTQ